MRQKKIKDATIENLEKLGVLLAPTPLKVDASKKITLEIGSGKGRFITSLANDFPEEVFIAVERDQNVCYRLAQKKSVLELKNLIVIMDDAEKLNEYLVDVKVDNLHLNFSDPWPKKKHHKRRLTYPTMLNQYKNYLKKDGKIIFRTDHADLFVDSFQYFNEASYIVSDCNWALAPSDYMTEYEVKKRLSGPIYQLIAEQIHD